MSDISPAVARQLKTQRRKIDKADRALMAALARRFEAVRAIGAIKKRAGLPVVQKARWKEVMRERLKRARNAKLDARFTSALFEMLQKEAIRVQKKGLK